MKGVILHGGSGTRLRPLTYTDVKQLLPLAGKPVSEYALENLLELGIKEINIIIGKVGAKEVKDYYGDGSRWGAHITYTYQTEPLGIAHAISLVTGFTDGDDYEVVFEDNYFQNGLKTLLEQFKEQKSESLIALTKVPNPSQFGIAEVQDGKITKLVEKPKEPKSNLAITGAYFLKDSIFEIIDNLKPSWRNELEITEAFQIMIERGFKIGYNVIRGWWKDTGTAEEFLECNRMVLDRIAESVSPSEGHELAFGRVSMGKGVKVIGKSKILGPAYIGDNTTITDSYIGPYTSIGSNCEIVNSEIEDSVIMDECRLQMRDGKRIRERLIGSNVRIGPLGSDLKPYRLIVGRDSKMEI